MTLTLSNLDISFEKSLVELKRFNATTMLNVSFNSFDLDPMTLVLRFCLNILKMNLYIQNDSCR